MRNATIEDVARVQAGEYVPNVMFEIHGGDKMHMKQSSYLLKRRLDCGQIVMETDGGELRVVHTSMILPLKKHAFNNTATKAKPKREHVKGKRKYEKVVYDPKRAVEVARKNGGWITLVYSGEKVKRCYSTGIGWWRDEKGICTGAIENRAGAYTHMYVPVKEEKGEETATSYLDVTAAGAKTFTDKYQLGEALYNLGWRLCAIDDSKGAVVVQIINDTRPAFIKYVSTNHVAIIK